MARTRDSDWSVQRESGGIPSATASAQSQRQRAAWHTRDWAKRRLSIGVSLGEQWTAGARRGRRPLRPPASGWSDLSILIPGGLARSPGSRCAGGGGLEAVSVGPHQRTLRSKLQMDLFDRIRLPHQLANTRLAIFGSRPLSPICIRHCSYVRFSRLAATERARKCSLRAWTAATPSAQRGVGRRLSIGQRQRPCVGAPSSLSQPIFRCERQSGQSAAVVQS